MDIATLLENHRRHMLAIVSEQEYDNEDELAASRFAIMTAHDRATTRSLLDIYRTANSTQPVGQSSPAQPYLHHQPQGEGREQEGQGSGAQGAGDPDGRSEDRGWRCCVSTRVTPDEWPSLRVVQTFIYSAPLCDTPEHTDRAMELFATPDNRAFAACSRCVEAVNASKLLSLEIVQ